MNNSIFTIGFESNTGTVNSIIINDDSNKMNWCNSYHNWGDIICSRDILKMGYGYVSHNIELVSFDECSDSSTSVYSNGKIEVTVVRSFTLNGNFKENYTFKNITSSDVFLRKGVYGIYTSFPDEYCKASVSLSERCDAHIWCGDNISWVNALRQGKSDYNIGLVLTDGSLTSYSMQSSGGESGGSFRGNIILNPDTVHLISGEEMTISWEIFVHKGTEDFMDKLYELNPISEIKSDKYTYYENETIEFSFRTKTGDISIFLGDVLLPYTKSGNIVNVSYNPVHRGEHRFDIIASGKKTHVLMNVIRPLYRLVENRIDFIVSNQQCLREDSPLYGAYLIYDTEDKCLYFDEDRVDHNACRERVGMALAICKYLQAHNNQKYYASLMLYIDFVLREFFDTETGEVYNTVGKNRNMIRLYNAPWLTLLFAEMYNLTSDDKYIEYIHRALVNYYDKGGAEFYPNGFNMKIIVDTIRKSGNMTYADEALSFFAAHTDNMLSVGFDYPAMEVIYEQTIVTPVVSYMCDMYALTGNKKYFDAAKEHMDNLARFDGMQPSHHLNGIPIRYWDDYWFGKSQMFADTLPHYWSCLSGRAWYNYYSVSGDKTYMKKAENCLRNCLSLFMEDGTASCAYVYPHNVDDKKGEFYDAWANDQDFALYFAMIILG